MCTLESDVYTLGAGVSTLKVGAVAAVMRTLNAVAA